MKLLVLIVYYATFNSNGVLGFDDDQIQSLPDLAYNLSFRQYSGYLSDGQNYLHYWFVESQTNPRTDPIIVWLSDGQQMSAMYGLLVENGPFRVKSDSIGLTLNPNSWNSLANLLYIDSVDSGCSYRTANESYTGTDNSTAVIYKNALDHFFVKFPQFIDNPVYIVGQMDGTPHVVTLALKLLRDNSTIRLRGIGLGDGRLDTRLSSHFQYHLLLNYGLLSIQAYKEILYTFCQCTAFGYVCKLNLDNMHKHHLSKQLVQELDQVSLINKLNVLSDCYPYTTYNQDTSNQIEPIHDQSNSNVSIPNCGSDSTSLFMNKPEVRTSLHISDNREWLSHSRHVTNTFTPDVRSQLKELITVHNMTNIIVYNGDLDLNYNFLANQRFVDSLGFKVNDRYRSWRVNGRIGGFVKRYSGITFTTVRGSGAAVSYDQPESSLAIIKELIGVSKLH